MPSPSPALHLPTAFFVIIGAAGLVLAGLGVLPGAPAWVWLAVLLAGAFQPHLVGWSADAASRTEDLRAAREALDNAGILHRARTEEWERRLEGVLTPEESRRVRADFNAVLLDFAKLRGTVEAVAKEQRVREMGDTFLGEAP